MHAPYAAAPNSPPSQKQHFAIVGSGIAGMSAAWLASSRCQVTVYERELRIGGHTHTVEVETPAGRIPVDTGFIVYNEANYPNLTALFRHLGVRTQNSEMTFGVSLDKGGLEYSSLLSGLTAQPSNFLRSDYRAMWRDLLRFYREAEETLDARDTRTTLGTYLDTRGYSEAFARFHLLPMAAAIWSSSLEDMRAHPVAAFARFFADHGLLKLVNRPRWRTVAGGSQEYAKKLIARYADRVRLRCGVRAILRDAAGVIIVDDNGDSARYDGVIIAAHADQALAMLSDASDEERSLLGSFHYRPNKAVLHSDPTLMPKRRRTWASWNYLGHTRDRLNDDLCVTYWMNKLQNIDHRAPLFVTLNPREMPRAEMTYGIYDYAHPVFDTAAMEAQQRLWHIQGVRSTWFCGSYFGSGFHEDALQAGLAAAEDATGARRPWTVAKESGRIVRIPQLAGVPA
ncbi:MAG TPA: FAD-dependent oxidoreductase [Rhizomicrobium sp.]|nr:FAD-dependent oxidoreductase [Rhizomicrobium sp.]